MDNLINTFKNLLVNEEVAISLETETMKGDVLDVGSKNSGVIYNLCKGLEGTMNVEYINSEEPVGNEKKYLYDTAVLFFTLGELDLKIQRRRLLKDVSGYLKDNGEIIIWDMQKERFKVVHMNLLVELPHKKIKKVLIKDYNPLKEISKENIIKLLKPMFEVIELKCFRNIYYIKAHKKGSLSNEDTFNSNKC